MNSDADKLWNEIAPKYRKQKNLCPLTPEEAETAFEGAPAIPLSKNEIRSIVESVTSKEQASPEFSIEEWNEEGSAIDIDDAVMAVYRNQSDAEADSETADQELRDQVLSGSKLSILEEQRLQEIAGKQADDIIGRLAMTIPIDPLAVAATEFPLLRVGGCDLGDRYDGKLEYHLTKNMFLLFFNTRYDRGLPQGEHHPRTRFSIAHELGHFFLEHHHRALRHGGKSHRSISEFRNSQQIEREADAFAASLLLPTIFVQPKVNQADLTLTLLDAIADEFRTSLVSAAIRCVRLSHFPCATAAIRDGMIAWMFLSEAMIGAGIYPRKETLRGNAHQAWQNFKSASHDRSHCASLVSDWFNTFDRTFLNDIVVSAEFHPVHTMEVLLVLLTIDENDLPSDDDDASKE